MSTLSSIFIGVPQSKYAGIAILVSLIFVAFAMLFGKEQVPIGQKFMFVLIMFIVALPSILFILFQLTCLVTGAGAKNQRWWCAAYAWIGTIFVIMYSVIVVVVGIMSLMNGTNVVNDVNMVMSFEQMKDMADRQAQEFFVDKQPTESFTVPANNKQPAESFTVPANNKQSAEYFNDTMKQPAEHFQDPSALMNQMVEKKEPFITAPVPPDNTNGEANKMNALNVPQPSMPAGTENFAVYQR
jgi:hypothetical protein